MVTAPIPAFLSNSLRQAVRQRKLAQFDVGCIVEERRGNAFGIRVKQRPVLPRVHRLRVLHIHGLAGIVLPRCAPRRAAHSLSRCRMPSIPRAFYWRPSVLLRSVSIPGGLPAWFHGCPQHGEKVRHGEEIGALFPISRMALKVKFL